ncbi:MAG: PAS domain S-box protein [Pseudomonadota bacterium]|nr:PAS domain S-box protein [Pseudomonadota bacterium]
MHNNTPVRLLYIEDNEVIGLLMQERLSQYGYQIELAKNGEIGLSQLDKNHYDIVIVDYLLPGMSGLQVLQHLFEHHKKTPAIMVTGAGNEEIAVEVMKLGSSDYLVKDTYGHYFELLPSVIERILEKQQLINEKKRIECALQDRDAILEAVSFAAEQFLTASCWTQPIQAVLARLGQAAQVSRAYIFQNHTDQAVLAPCYHWLSEHNTDLATQANFPRWRQLLSQGQAVYGLVEDLPAEEIEVLQAQQIQSVVAVPIFVGKQWWGFIRYDDCQSRHTWLPIVVEALKTAANILGAAIQQKQTDQALQHSEQQLNTFVQTADDMFCFRTLAGELIPLNAAFVKITGYSTDEFAQHWRTLMHPSDLKRWDDFCAQHPAGIDTFEWEYRLCTPSGEWRWIHSRMVGSQNKQGEYSGYNCVDRDITERKRTEEALRRSEAQLAQAQRIAHLGSWEWDVHTNTYWWSVEAFHIAGITPTDDGSHDNIFQRQIHPADQAEVQHKQQQLQHHPQGYQLEFRILRPDGKMRYVHCRAQPVFDDTQQLSRLLGTVQDITERKLSEEALRRSEQTLRAIMNATTDTVIMLTPEGICVTLNPTAEAILNTQRPIMGQCLYELLLPDLRAQVRSMVEQVVATQEPVFFVDARQGIWFEGNFYPVIHDAKVTHVVIFARDITERKLAEEALTQNEQALRAILNAVTDTIVLLEQNETCVVINPAGAAKLGHRSDDIVGQCIYDFLPAEAVQKRKTVVEQVIQTQTPMVQEDNRNGIWFEDNFYPVLDERNTVSQIAIFSKDITERKRTEQALLESKRRYESIFNGAEVSIWEQDFYAVWQQLQRLKHQGITELQPYLQAHPHYVQQLSQQVTIKAVNAATLRLFAAANQAELLTHLEYLSTPDTRNTFIAILGAIWDNQRVFQAETRYQTLSGRPLTVMLSMPIPSQAEEFRHLPVSILDITERQQAEQKLRESEERYRQLFVGNQAVEWLVDPKDGHIIDANEAASRYYGYSLAQLKTMTVYDLNPRSPAALAEQIHQAQAKNGGQFFFQHRLASGEIRDVEVHSGPVVIEGKALLYSIIHDITERRQAERALRESEKKYRTIINTTAEGYWLIDPRTQETREVNESLCRMLGYERSEMIGKTPFEFLDEESHGLLEIPLRQLTTTAHYSQELALKKRNGAKVFIQANATLMYDSSNKSLSLFAFITDITTRKRAEEALRKERDFTNAVINTAGSLVVVFDRQGRIVRFNQTCEQISGYRFTEVQQYPIWDIFVLPEELAKVKDAFERLNAHQQPVRYESHWLTKNQQLRLIDWFNTVLLDDQGDIEYIIGTGIDITERKQAEHALERTLAEQDAILDNSMVGIALLAADRTFLRVNQKLEDIFGYAETELVGRSTEILYPSQQEFEQLGAEISGLCWMKP